MVQLSRSTTAAALNVAILTGTTRLEGPPRPILGPRVQRFIEHVLLKRGHAITTVVDPRNLPLLEKPHFAFSKSQVPTELDEMNRLLLQSDAYVMITPEYNHGPSPGLLNTLNHFGSSTFSFKPSAIVTYSAGQWGGTRAASALRPILSELGCLPVSAMIHIPHAQQVFHEDGSTITTSKNDDDDWEKYASRCISQLEWWGEAASNHTKLRDPFEYSPPFSQTPTQRNAP